MSYMWDYSFQVVPMQIREATYIVIRLSCTVCFGLCPWVLKPGSILSCIQISNIFLWLLLACGKAFYCCARDYSTASSSGLGAMGVPYNG